VPELPEIETIVRGLAPRLEGAGFGRPRLLYPRLLRRSSPSGLAALEGLKILALGRRGKMLTIRCEGGRTLVFHLKMTGQMLLVKPGTPEDKHTRLILPLAGRGLELRFRDIRKFGFLCCLSPGESAPELDALGPEPLEIDFPSFARLFEGRRGRLKSLLLNQRVIAGIGNIYADEILFRARIHPEIPASSLGKPELRSLWKATRVILNQAISRKGSTISDFADPDGRPGNYQELHKAYGREGERCVRCGTAIRRIVIGGRSSFYCPSCQDL
jgi:formamidopyrimidine-DNA glycosylase